MTIHLPKQHGPKRKALVSSSYPTTIIKLRKPMVSPMINFSPRRTSSWEEFLNAPLSSSINPVSSNTPKSTTALATFLISKRSKPDSASFPKSFSQNLDPPSPSGVAGFFHLTHQLTTINCTPKKSPITFW